MQIACVLFLASALLALPADTQTAKPKLTLAQALKTLPAADTLVLTVGAEKVTLPDGIEPPPTGASAGDIAAAFGEITQRFGAVTAIAPATMTLLNTQPDPPNFEADIGGYQALKILAASLDDVQWRAIISEQGLGLADLSDDTQRGLFHALFRNRQLWIASDDPALSMLPAEKRADIRDVTSEIDSTHIRLGQTANLYLHDRQGKTIYYSGTRLDGPPRLHTYRPKTPPLTPPPPPVVYSVALKAAFPNTPKPSDLSWDGKALQTSISTAGLKTVGDLVSRLGQKTGLELYADPHYAAKRIILLGSPAAAPASDLLQALCLCVTGTFRKVGPAWVLTDDLVGVGVRRKHLADWKQQAEDAASKVGDEAGAVMLKRRASDARKLRGFGDPVALTPEEFAALPDDPAMPGIPTLVDIPEAAYPFAKLTPAQQAWARQTAAAYNENLHTAKLPDYLSDNETDDADLTRTVSLGAKYQVQLLVPSQSAPVNTNLQSPLELLFYPGETPEAYKAYADADAKKRAKMPPPPPLSVLLRRGSRRGIVGNPRTAADVDALIRSMQQLGLNQLWLDVFSNGVSHLKVSTGGPDILTEALTKTRGTGIEVYAAVSLFAWDDTAPDSARDLTIDGQDSRQALLGAKQHTREVTDDEEGLPIPFPASVPVLVSAAAPAVAATLMAMVQDCGARSGLAGFVWHDADAGSEFGYTPPMRLAFLRTFRADPTDIDPGSSLGEAAALPLFDDDAIDSALSGQWLKFRTDTDVALLRHLRAMVRLSLPVLMEQDELYGDNWLANWDDPAKPPPTVRDLTPGTAYASAKTTLRLMKQASRIIIRRKTIRHDGDTAFLARRLQDDAKTLPSDGFVLDFSSDSVTQGAAPLASLVQAVAAEPKSKAK